MGDTYSYSDAEALGALARMEDPADPVPALPSGGGPSPPKPDCDCDGVCGELRDDQLPKDVQVLRPQKCLKQTCCTDNQSLYTFEPKFSA